MKNVQFKQIAIQNFLSIGKEIKIVFTPGINFITGENKDKGGRNGVGKTTILEGFFWCLFGKTLRDLKNENIINNITKKECKVVLDFSVNDKQYSIIRTAKPSAIQILENGIDVTLSTLPKNNEFVEQLVGQTVLFENSVLLSTTGTIPFFAQKKIDKRKFLEGIFQLEVFSDMLSSIRSQYNELKKTYEIQSGKFEENVKTKGLLTEQSGKYEKQKEEKINALNVRIKDCNADLDELTSKLGDTDTKEHQNKIEAFKVKKEALDVYIRSKNAEKSSLSKEEGQYEQSVRNITDELRLIKKKDTRCPTCNRPYDQDPVKIQEMIDNINTRLTTHTESLNKVRVKIKEFEDSLSEYYEGQKKIDTKINDLNQIIRLQDNLNLQIKNAKGKIDSLQQDIEKLQQETDPNIDILKRIEDDIKKLEETIDQQQKELTILENAKFVVSEEGVKTYIIKKIINLLNSKVNDYLYQLEAPCKCQFDEQFEETLFNENEVECSYFNFSGGERKRIDLAILFTFQDLLKHQMGINYSFSGYDELFDSALDAKGIQSVLSILKNRVEKFGEQIYIISHNFNTVSSENIDNTIFLRKFNGLTELVE